MKSRKQIEKWNVALMVAADLWKACHTPAARVINASDQIDE